MKRLNVLLVDDDPEVLRVTSWMLSARHDVRSVAGFREAMHELHERMPDAIVCDLELEPYRGDVFLSMVAREFPEVRRVLYTTALPSGALQRVAHRILFKPSTFEELDEAITGDYDDYDATA
jgi:DNA-binding NtrC family response regulator